MERKPFSDLIDAFGKVTGDLKPIVNLPKSERETMRRTLDETCRVIDTTPGWTISTSGFNPSACFASSAACASPCERRKPLAGRLAGTVSAKDWDAMGLQMSDVLANDASSKGQNPTPIQSVRDALAAFNASLVDELQKLIKQEHTFYEIVQRPR